MGGPSERSQVGRPLFYDPYTSVTVNLLTS